MSRRLRKRASSTLISIWDSLSVSLIVLAYNIIIITRVDWFWFDSNTVRKTDRGNCLKQEGKYVVCPQKGKVCSEGPGSRGRKGRDTTHWRIFVTYIFLGVTITTQRATHINSNPTLLLSQNLEEKLVCTFWFWCPRDLAQKTAILQRRSGWSCWKGGCLSNQSADWMTFSFTGSGRNIERTLTWRIAVFLSS